VVVSSFRYAAERHEVLGYGRSLASDEVPRLGAAAVTPLYLAAAARAIRREASARQIDLLHAHWVVPNGVAALFAGGNLPLAIGLHGSDVFMAEKPLVRRLVSSALRRAALLTGCSPELVDRVCALGFPSSDARVIPYGVDVEVFSPDAGRDAEWRARLGISSDAVVVLTVGRMVSKKGYDVLVEALPSLLEGNPEVHVVMAGEGDRRQEWIDATETWRDRVHFPGAVRRDTLPDLYRAADLFVLPAVHDRKGNVDGLPNVILEAMASGLPVVASGISGIPLAIDHGKQGLLVAERDPEDLGRSLSLLCSNPDRLRVLGRAARAKAEEELTWDVIAARYREGYQAALERSGRRSP
jgi:glycosyltransferase involved in cell wall biosynthesis